MNSNPPLDDGYMPQQRITYDGKRMRSKPINRKTVDFNSPVINHLIVRPFANFSLLTNKNRQYARDHRDMPFLKPIEAAQQEVCSI